VAPRPRACLAKRVLAHHRPGRVHECARAEQEHRSVQHRELWLIVPAFHPAPVQPGIGGDHRGVWNLGGQQARRTPCLFQVSASDEPVAK